jgi:hypothetical protein
VPDGVCVVWTGLVEKPFEVVHRQPCLTLVVASGGQGVPHAGATRLTIGHGRGPLKALFAPLFVAFAALLGAIGDDVRRHVLVAARGHLPGP